MDVRSALVDGIHQHLVHEAHHGRIVRVALGLIRPGVLLVTGTDLQVVQIPVQLLVTHAEIAVGGIQGALDAALELIVFHQNGFGGQPCMELELVQGAQVGGVGDGYEQPLAALEQRQRLVMADEFLLDQLDGVGVQLERIHVQQRDAELQRGGMGEIPGTDQILVDEVHNQRLTRFARRIHGCAGVGLLDEAVPGKSPGQTAELESWVRSCHGSEVGLSGCRLA